MKEVSLARLDSHFRNDFPNGNTVDMFGNDFATKLLSSLYYSSNDTLFLLAFIKIFNKTSVNLDNVRPPARFKTGKIGTFRSEVIERDFAPHSL